MAEKTFETPWGETTTNELTYDFGDGRISTGELTIPTDAGLAQGSFHVDMERDSAPALLRLVLLGGYSVPGMDYPGERNPSGTSTVVDGEGGPLAWRAQLRIDPMADADAPYDISVMLVSENRRIGKTEPAAEGKVRDAVRAAIADGYARDDGFAARMYVAMMAVVVEGMDDVVDGAKKSLDLATERRDKARGLVEAAAERAQGGTAPTP